MVYDYWNINADRRLEDDILGMPSNTISKKGKLIIVSGPSGVGKGTIVRGVSKNPKIPIYWGKTATTRRKRQVDSSRHIFMSKSQFKKMLKEGKIVEYNIYNRRYYGSLRDEINKIDQGKNVILEIDINGALNIKKQYPEAILIFIDSDLETVEKRLRERGQEDEKTIQKRLKIAKREIKMKNKYDYVVENPQGYPESTVKKILEIIRLGDRH